MVRQSFRLSLHDFRESLLDCARAARAASG